MTTQYKSGRLVRALAALCLGGAAAGCAQPPTQEGSAQAMPDTQAMVNQAMQNMQRIMGMPESERTNYVMTAQQSSVEHGEDLFRNAQLGTNGQSCASCHPGGGTTGAQIEMMPGMRMPIPDLHGVSRTFPKFKVPNDAVITLAEMNNNCLVMFQQGSPLALNSQDSRDLATYVDSLAR